MKLCLGLFNVDKYVTHTRNSSLADSRGIFPVAETFGVQGAAPQKYIFSFVAMLHVITFIFLEEESSKEVVCPSYYVWGAGRRVGEGQLFFWTWLRERIANDPVNSHRGATPVS